MNVLNGNAIDDGREFRFWIVGDIEKWCAQRNMPFDKQRHELRNSDDVEIKWGIYKKGQERAQWASSSNRTGMSILIRGDCVFRFRDPDDHSNIRDVRVMKEGDYVIWKENIEHTWKMLDDSVFVTIRWEKHPGL